MRASKLSAAQIAFVQKQAEEEHRGCGGQRERVTREEAMSAARSAGARDIESVRYLVLESDGTISAAIRQGRQ